MQLQLDDVETIWQGGTLVQRRRLLAQLRSIKSGLARQWLLDVWKKEKAEARLGLLDTLKIGLSSEDEPFLEDVLDDRNESVREAAALQLALLPTSALLGRMEARADRMLHYENGKLILTNPGKIDKTWLRDGITELPPQSREREVWYPRQVLTLVPLNHWEEHFAAQPSDLINAATAGDLNELLLSCWSYAALRSEAPQWLEPLWKWWCTKPLNTTIRNVSLTSLYKAITTRLPQHVIEWYAQQYTARDEHWENLLAALPTPWSEQFSAARLEELREYLLEFNDGTHPSYQWHNVLTTTALALPPASFKNALRPWKFPDEMNWQLQQWQRQLNQFTALILMRKRMIEEIS